MNVSAIGSVSRLGVSSTTGLQSPTAAREIGGANSAKSVDGSNGEAAPGTNFANALGQAFGSLNSQLTAADSTMADFAAGGNADLHTVMLQMEEASIGLKLGVQVRDKLLEAYQEIMRTQL